MKKIAFFGAVASALLLASCTNETNQEMVIGSWNATSMKVDSVEMIDSIDAFTNVVSVFNADGTGTGYNAEDTVTYTYTIDDSHIMIYGADTLHLNIVELNNELLRYTGFSSGSDFDYTFEK